MSNRVLALSNYTKFPFPDAAAIANLHLHLHPIAMPISPCGLPWISPAISVSLYKIIRMIEETDSNLIIEGSEPMPNLNQKVQLKFYLCKQLTTSTQLLQLPFAIFHFYIGLTNKSLRLAAPLLGALTYRQWFMADFALTLFLSLLVGILFHLGPDIHAEGFCSSLLADSKKAFILTHSLNSLFSLAKFILTVAIAYDWLIVMQMQDPLCDFGMKQALWLESVTFVVSLFMTVGRGVYGWLWLDKDTILKELTRIDQPQETLRLDQKYQDDQDDQDGEQMQQI